MNLRLEDLRLRRHINCINSVMIEASLSKAEGSVPITAHGTFVRGVGSALVLPNPPGDRPANSLKKKTYEPTMS